MTVDRDWVESVRHVSLARALEDMSPILVCSHGCDLRSHNGFTYTGRWNWVPRKLVLIRVDILGNGAQEPVLLWYDPHNSGGSSNRSNNVHVPEEACLPCGMLRLAPAPQHHHHHHHHPNEDASPPVVAMVGAIPDHPRHLEVQIRATSLASLQETIVTEGPHEKPKQKRKKKNQPSHNVSDSDDARGEVFAWRLRLPDEETKTLWFETMTQLISSVVPSCPEREVEHPNPRLLSHKGWLLNLTALLLPILLRGTFIQVIGKGAAGAGNHVPGGNSSGGVTILPVRVSEVHAREMMMAQPASELEWRVDDGFATPARSDRTHPPLPTAAKPITLADRSAARIVSSRLSNVLGWLWHASHQLTMPSEATSPPKEVTLLRRTATALSDCVSAESEECGLFTQQASFIIDNAWVSLPAMFVLVLSTASMVNRMAPQLGSFAWSTRYWFCSAGCFVATVLLGDDTYRNYLQPERKYGLYWTGWIHGWGTLGMLGLSAILLRWALKLPPPRQPISAARKASAGLSLIVGSLSVPLALRSVQGGTLDGSAGVYAVSSALCFFVGTYFLGRAIRNITVGGVEIGYMIHRASLLPARCIYCVLGGIGDVAHLVAWLTWKVLVLVRYAVYRTGQTVFNWIQRVREKARNNGRLVRLYQSLVLTVTLWWYCFVHLVVKSCKAAGDAAMVAVNFILHKVALRFLRLVAGIVKALVSVVKRLAYLWRVFVVPWWRKVFTLVVKTAGAVSDMATTVERVALGVFKDFMRRAGAVKDFVLLEVARPISWAVKRQLLSLLGAATRFLRFILHVAIYPSFRAIHSLLAVFIHLLRLTIHAADSLLSLVVGSVAYATDRLGEALTAILRLAWQLILQPLLTQCWRTCLGALGRLYELAVDVVDRIVLGFLQPARLVLDTVMVLVQLFFKKYWLLAASALSLNASLQFAGRALTISSSLRTAGFYGLGAWALLLVGHTLARAVVNSDGSLVDQYAILGDSSLRLIDFHIGYFLLQVLSSGWHALGTASRLLLRSIDVVIRGTFIVVWRGLQLVHERGIRPVVQTAKAALRIIWDSPHFSMLASLVALFVVYLNHSGVINFAWLVQSSNSSKHLLTSIPTKGAMVLLDCFSRIPRVFVLNRVLTSVREVYNPVIDFRATSPTAAFSCWLFIVFLKLTKRRVRIKVFGVPIVFMYLVEASGLALLRAYAFSYAVWVCLQLVVEKYEWEQQRLAQEGFISFQHQKGIQVSQEDIHGDKQITRQDDQIECCICLSAYSNAMVELPCGHQFHKDCINDWLKVSKQRRCPLCRRATGGFDRVLEVVF